MTESGRCIPFVRHAVPRSLIVLLIGCGVNFGSTAGSGDDFVRAGRSSQRFDLMDWVRKKFPPPPPPTAPPSSGASDLGTMVLPLDELHYYANTLDVALNLSVSGEGRCIQADLYKGVSYFLLTNDCEGTSLSNTLILAPGSYWGIKPYASGGVWRTSIVALGAGITWDQLGWNRAPYTMAAFGAPVAFDCTDLGFEAAREFRKPDDTGLGHLVQQMPSALSFLKQANAWSWYRLERWKNGRYEFVENFKLASATCKPEHLR